MTAPLSLLRRAWPPTAAGLFLGLALLTAAAEPAPTGERLTSRPRPTAAEIRPAAVGDEVRTGDTQRRRLPLADGSVVYVNRRSEVKVTGERRLRVSAGQVFVAVAPGAPAFTVTTPDREVTCEAGAFVAGVVPNRDKGPGTGVIVARGRVQVSGVAAALRAGQKLPFDGNAPVPAQRASFAADWARELLDESPLVPVSRYVGGALVALDPDGQESRLSLRKYHVDVHIEDGFARTTIDQTYFNDTAARLEGTFHFPLPPDASLSRLAMYVDGKLMEGGMVERNFGRQVYEKIVTSQRDPALLEWVDGSTFKMRVFPLEARQEKRIVLSYTQRLPVMDYHSEYRFPAGNGRDVIGDWSFNARIKGGKDVAWSSPSHQLIQREQEGDLLLGAREKNVKADRDVVLSLTDPRAAEEESARFSSFEQDGPKYLMLRYRPALPTRDDGPAGPRSWVFLFESSGDRDPLLARTQVEIIRGLLANAEPDDTFAVLAAGTRVRAFADQPRPVTPENVRAALAFLEGSHLIGALDLGQALAAAEPLLKAGRNAHLVHVGSGIAAMGEKRDDLLAKRLPDGARYVGVGVGRRWNRNLMKIAAERTGGYFTQINPDEPVSWRAFDLSATLNTPRLLDMTVTDRAGKATFLPFTSMAAQGEELCAVARVGAGETSPEAVTVRGRLNGQPFERELPVRAVTANVGHLPRTWAKLEIERLLAADAVKNRDGIIGLSKAIYVMTPYTSLLVLESEEMYQQYKVDRGRKDHWAMYPCPENIPVVYEPLEGMPPDPKKAGKPSAEEVARTVLLRSSPPQREERLTPSEPFASYAATFARTGRFLTDSDYVAILSRAALPRDLEENVDHQATASRGFIDAVGPVAGRWKAAEVMKHLPEFKRLGIDPSTPEGARLAVKLLEPVGISDSSPSAPQYDSFPGLGSNVSGPESLRLYGDSAITGTGIVTNSITSRHASPVRFAAGQFSKASFAVMREEREGKPSVPLDSESLLYRRPPFKAEDNLFFDLVSYAPGLDTSRADLLAVLEAEAAPSKGSRPGGIDDGARKLFGRAGIWNRLDGPQTVTFPAAGDQPAFSISFDNEGRYSYERTLPPGIRERVVCDGKTLWHLYPDLGLGARRTVSRFHRLDFARLVPWAVPAAEDLARGADLKTIAERTVALIPHGADALKDGDGKPVPYAQVQFVFTAACQLAERQVVEMPTKKVLRREVYAADGTTTTLDGNSKVLATVKATLETWPVGRKFDVTPDTRGLVILSLPYRDADTVRKARGIDKKSLQDLPFDDALALLGAEFAAGNGNGALEVCQRSFFRRDQKQLGLYVLLAACGVNLDAGNADVLEEHLHEPLAQYLALHSSPVLRRHASQWAVGSGQWRDGYLAHLALTHALFQRLGNGKALGATDAQRREERERALEYVRRNKGTAFAWGLLCLMKDRADEDEAKKKEVSDTHKALAEAWLLFEPVPALSYAAKYEHARSLAKCGQRARARQRFGELYEQALKEGGLPPIDGDFRAALLGEGQEADLWTDLVRRTAAALVGQKKRPAVLALASQCRQVGDESLAGRLVDVALDGITDAKERTAMTLAAIDFLKTTGQFAAADVLLAGLLDDAGLAKRADLWRLAGAIAKDRDQPAREFECLERALDAEYRELPEVIDLKEVRGDYERLLGHYQELASALARLKMRPPADFVAKVVRTADRWRALDPEADAACELAGRILRTVGERELLWDYLTTPVGRRPNEAGPWVALADTLRRTGELGLADRAYAAAFEAEPTDAQVLWDRAQNLRQAGQSAEAQKLYRQLAEGDWSPRFNWVRTQAKWQLERR